MSRRIVYGLKGLWLKYMHGCHIAKRCYKASKGQMNKCTMIIEFYLDELLKEQLDHGSDLGGSVGLQHQALILQLQFHSACTLLVN